MIVLTFLTVCQALRWSQTGEPLKKAERKEAKLERKLEKSQARVNDPSLRRQLSVGSWSYKLPFDQGVRSATVGRSKCLLRSAEQKKCCDNTEVCPGCDPLLLARGFSCEEQLGNTAWDDPNWLDPDYCHCSSSYG